MLLSPLLLAVTLRNAPPGAANSSVDAHDGPIVQWEPGGLFYRYAMAYTPCALVGGGLRGAARRALNRFIEAVKGNGFDCAQVAYDLLSDGFGRDCGFLTPSRGQTVRVYTSADLSHWTHAADALLHAPAWLRDESIVFRPAVLYSRATRRYVLWLNRLPRAEPVVEAYRRAGFVVGTSDAPEGPFEFAPTAEEATPPMAHAGGADFALLASGGEAHIVYGAWHNMGITSGWRAQLYPEHMRHSHQIAVQRLDESFTRAVGEAVTVSEHGQEAPSWFRRGELWYLIYGHTCCFCKMGSDARVYVGSAPMGPYEYAGHLNDFGDAHVPAQNSGIVEVTQADGSNAFIWVADMWMSAASGLKGDDLQYWHPLTFVTREVRGLGRIPVPERQGPPWLEAFELNLSHIKASRGGQASCDDDANVHY